MAFVSKKENLSPSEIQQLKLLKWLHDKPDKYGKPLIELGNGYSFDNYIDYFYIDGVFVVLTHQATPGLDNTYTALWLVDPEGIASVSCNYDLDPFEAFSGPQPEKKENFENIALYFLTECIQGTYNTDQKPYIAYQYRCKADFIDGMNVWYSKIDPAKKYIDVLIDDIDQSQASFLSSSKNHIPIGHVDLISIPSVFLAESGLEKVLPSLRNKVEVEGVKTWH